MSEYGCKVCRVLSERDLDHLDDELVARWQGDGYERMGYRRLATWLNVSLLRREMDRAGVPTIGGEARSRYERLTDEDPRTAAEVHDLLRTAGIPVDDLERDFVSYGVVRTHLLECLDLEIDQEHSNGDWGADTLAYLREDATEKATDAVRSLVRNDRVAVGAGPTVSISIDLECEQCGAVRPASEALNAGAVCSCEEN